eukprot:6367777-Amphidinium_carterae.4
MSQVRNSPRTDNDGMEGARYSHRLILGLGVLDTTCTSCCGICGGSSCIGYGETSTMPLSTSSASSSLLGSGGSTPLLLPQDGQGSSKFVDFPKSILFTLRCLEPLGMFASGSSYLVVLPEWSLVAPALRTGSGNLRLDPSQRTQSGTSAR